MSLEADNRLYQLKRDNYYRLLSDAFLNKVSILMDGEYDDLESELLASLAGQRERNGKLGMYVLVLPLEVTGVRGGQSPSAALTVRQRFTIGENVRIAQGSDGPQITSAAVAARLEQLFHGCSFHGVAEGMRLERMSEVAEFEGERGYVVSFVADEFYFNYSFEAGLVTIAESSGTITLTANPNGDVPAASVSALKIYYTTDGSYPGSENPTATEYSAPFEAGAGVEIRAAAEEDEISASKIVTTHEVIG
jgi:hypothetical protein